MIHNNFDIVLDSAAGTMLAGYALLLLLGAAVRVQTDRKAAGKIWVPSMWGAALFTVAGLLFVYWRMASA